MTKAMSSSSKDQAESSREQTETDKKTTRYECPPDFVSFCHAPCSSTLTDSLKNDNELWLIKAPASFDPGRFHGMKVPLSGLQTLKVPTTAGARQAASGHQMFSVLASNHFTSDLHLLTSDKRSSDAGLVFGPSFSGLLNVCERYEDSSTNRALQVIPAAPVPSIPPGLKQRFHPFGSKTPTLTCVAENETDGAAFGPSSATLRPLVMKRFLEEGGQGENEEEGRKKKKKKRIKTEYVEEMVRVKVEPVEEIHEATTMALPFQDDEHSTEKRKKKKKKKDREREEVEEGLEPGVGVKVKQEPIKYEPVDFLIGEEMESSGKKKKKKKKKKSKSEAD
ncbi:DNA-directed RNA polymerase I subunit RPA34 [Pholidichthys leucotaenia]